MVDVAGTMVIGRPVKDLDSVTTCIAMVCGWIAYFGAMKTLRIDGGSSLTSQVTQFVVELFGVSFIDVGAADEHEHSAHVETVHKDLRNELNRAELKGELRQFSDIELATAMWMIKKNQLDVQHGTTRFERTYGQPARTTLSVLETPPALLPLTMEVDDANFVRCLRKEILQLIDAYCCAKTKESRTQLLLKDVKFHKSKAKVDDTRIGQWVSHDGKRWNVIHLSGHTADEPQKARLKRVQNDGTPVEKTVLITDTTPLADLYPDIHYPRAKKKPAIDDFVFADELDGIITGGRVMRLEDDEHAIHQYWPSATYSHWQPVWILHDGRLDRKKVAPEGAEPKILHFGYDRTIAIGTIGDNAQLSSNLMKELAAQCLLNPADTESEATQNAKGQSTTHTATPQSDRRSETCPRCSTIHHPCFRSGLRPRCAWCSGHGVCARILEVGGSNPRAGMQIEKLK